VRASASPVSVPGRLWHLSGAPWGVSRRLCLPGRPICGGTSMPGGREFLLTRPAYVVPLAGHHVLGEQSRAGEQFIRAGDDPGIAVDHRAAVVDRVLEHRTGEYQAVRQRDRHADRAIGTQADARDGTVQVQGRLVEAVARRHDHRPAPVDHAKVGDQPCGEVGEQVVSVGAPLLTEPAVPSAPGTGKRVSHLLVISRGNATGASGRYGLQLPHRRGAHLSGPARVPSAPSETRKRRSELSR
jgi:hypothetical protein